MLVNYFIFVGLKKKIHNEIVPRQIKRYKNKYMY